MSTIGCIRSRMGTTPYYITKIPVGELIRSVGIAKELPEWDDMTADEKMQRECDLKRVIEEIVPYLVQDPDHFFGSLIIDIFSGFEDIVFESLADIVAEVPAAYKVPLQDFGTLTLPGKERLIALDGQHRLLALKIAVMGASGVPAGYTKNINNLKPHPELVGDELSVILVKHESNLKIRKIFNKINKYAKQTSRSDNIITSDDDPFAVISRKLITAGEVLQPVNGIDIVNWKNTSLSERSKNLTTLSAVYNITETLLKSDELTSHTRLSDEDMAKYYQEVETFWRISMEKIEVFKEYIRLTEQNKPVSSLRENNLLMKPVTQMSLAYVAKTAKNKGVKWENICHKLNQIDWSFYNEFWFNILVIPRSNKKMITGTGSVRQMGKVLAYVVMGTHMSDDEVEEVIRIIRNAKNDDSFILPPPVVLDDDDCLFCQ